jgi:hypothetical protein
MHHFDVSCGGNRIRIERFVPHGSKTLDEQNIKSRSSSPTLSDVDSGIVGFISDSFLDSLSIIDSQRQSIVTKVVLLMKDNV